MHSAQTFHGSCPPSRTYEQLAESVCLFHGTSRHRARSILRSGFRRATDPDASYTGTAINLSESATIAYEYGDYENEGCVLEVMLRPGTVFSSAIDSVSGQSPGRRLDNWFLENCDAAAVKLYCGNVWLIWDTSCIQSIHMLTKREATIAVAECLQKDGPEFAYNASVQDIADAYWGRECAVDAMRLYLARCGLLGGPSTIRAVADPHLGADD